jgi:microcystin degradation protein MlrC
MQKIVSMLVLVVAYNAFAPHAAAADGTSGVKTIAVIEMAQETNSFSPVPTTRADFSARSLYYGEEIIAVSKKEEKQLAGFLEAVEDFGAGRIAIVPILKAWSMSGGPVQGSLYDEFKHTIVDALLQCERLDGIYLSLHGAMGVEGLRDPEGDLLETIRTRFGPEIPIGVTFDLHANVTQRHADMATFIIGYKTNPHRDHFDVGYRAGEILIRTVKGEIEPVMAFNKMRLLKGGGMTIDFLAPMRKIFKRMKKMVKSSEKVLDVSNFMVHIWLDDPELGWSTVAITDNDLPLAQSLADEIADMNWSVRAVAPPEGNTPSEAIAIARGKSFLRKFGTVVFCDVSDAVGAGAPGENTWILNALLEEGADLTSYLFIRDAEAAQKTFSHDIGDHLKLVVGGRLDTVYNHPVAFSGRVMSKRAGPLGKTAVLVHQGIHLIVTELPSSAWSPAAFTDLGLSLWKADVVVVKNLFPFRYRFLLYNRKTVNVMTSGTTDIDVFSLKYKTIPRPIYPLDNIENWK